MNKLLLLIILLLSVSMAEDIKFSALAYYEYSYSTDIDTEISNQFEFHRVYTDQGTVDKINKECRSAQIGCVDCKKIMARNLIKALEPIRAQRAYYEARPERVTDIITEGCRKADAVAKITMAEVRTALNI